MPLAGPVDESLQYLEGVLWADPDLRLNPAVDAKDIDQFGTGTKAFWRGLLETAGYIGMSASSSDRAYPRVELKAGHGILTKLLAFLQEEVCARQHVEWLWDADGKLGWQAMGGFIRITGQKAQDIVRVLYLDQTVGRVSARHVADRIVGWTGKK